MEPVLIVEDNAIQGTLLKRVLTQNGYEVEWARDGEAALAWIKERRPRLVISDIEMPGISGFELCSTMKRNPSTRSIPVILLTALSHAEDVVRGLQSGADNYVTKPYDDAYLLEKASTLLAKHESTPFAPQNSDTIEIVVAGTKHMVAVEMQQVLNLLLSTYEGAVHQNRELARVNQQLVTAQQELGKRNQQLEALDQQKSHLLGMAAHDLRNPLGVILAYSKFLLGTPAHLDEKRIKFISKIQSSAGFMLHLIEDLLDVSKIESGKLDLNLKDTDVMALVRQNVDLNSALAEVKNISLVLKETAAPPSMQLDGPKIEQVLNNLLSNAIKFSHTGTTVSITAGSENGNLAIRVQDQGQGIPPEEIDRLFKPFSTTTVRGTQGEASTGLGLAIAHKIIEGHGGRITVESEFGKGTRFSVILPVA